jgi:hypothetical protein
MDKVQKSHDSELYLAFKHYVIIIIIFQSS